jgi:murein DD-endopeptidase MepM/ murein hydrolase activator NlpD
MDTRRHAPLGRVRVRFAPTTTRSRPHAYLGRGGRPLAEIYISDHAEALRGGRFRWLLSTCLAATVGVLAILVVLAGSTEGEDDGSNWYDKIWKRLEATPLSVPRRTAAKEEGLHWAVQKSDKLILSGKAAATRYYIPDGVQQRRANRDYTKWKYYVRLHARLGPVPKSRMQAIPAFEPFKLYANATPLEGCERTDDGQNANVRVIELNGILPNEDGQELEATAVLALVTRLQAAGEEPAAGGGELLAERAQRAVDREAPQTTQLIKTSLEQDDLGEDPNVRVLPPVKVQRGDTLPRILARLGAQSWQVRAMMEATRSSFPDSALLPDFEVRATTLPSPARPNSGEVVRFSIFDERGGHKVTVTRNATGEYVPSITRGEERVVLELLSDRDQAQDNSLYASMFATIEPQGVAPETIMQIMRIHAYTTDFRQRVRAGDTVEFFFDMKGEDKGIDGEIGELLATTVTAGGDTHKFYRFTTSDGTTDFYDAEGSTSRKFLMRRPVRGEDVRLTSGFGLRRHPLLMTAKMHYGVDWATAPGTPIMAAGNGVIEEVGPKGEYGNYIRIRHANGYKTAYGHMQRFATGVGAGVRVLQGQVIGYVGSTGLSSGPHLHFEVMVKNTYDSQFSHVDPRSIQVPNDRQLTGKELADFKREVARVETLMRKSPVAQRVAEELAQGPDQTRLDPHTRLQRLSAGQPETRRR